MSPRSCYQHEDRQVLAHCSVCARPCCRDCTIEMLDDYFCATCKVRVAKQLYGDQVHPDAVRVLLMGVLSIFVFAVGPYAIWRAARAAKSVERAPWLRGRWHVRAAFVLSGFGTALGLLWVASRLLTGGGG